MEIIRQLIDEIYGKTFPADKLAELINAVSEARLALAHPRKAHWDERDVVLITYADQFREPETPTLQTLSRFYQRYLQSTFSLLHLLPFYPWSSDDGFAVIDYQRVSPSCGNWDDVAELHQHARLMFDFVCNHMSAHSQWFQHYLAQEPGWDDFFISIHPATDLSAVTRPRTSPLLTPFQTASGDTKLIWTTFSADQVDLNYATPAVLLKMVSVLLDYLAKGADYVRLDAVGYMWKTPGTSCIHQPKTHQLVKLFRAIVNEVAAGTVMLTETNVPHQDNISYLGNGCDEAQMVYQFSLPPLVLHAIHYGSSHALKLWAKELPASQGNTSWFNFLASHDGIGLNPLRGLLPESEIVALVKDLSREGALVSYKNNPDGTTSPYEVNVTYLDALNKTDDSDETRLHRFMLAHALLLAFPGIPAVYIQSILGSRNNLAGVKETGYNRAINRQKYQLNELEAELDAPDSLRHKIFNQLSQLIKLRTRQPAFHPDNPMTVLESDNTVLAFWRHADRQQLLCLYNFSQAETLYALPEAQDWQNMIDGQKVSGSQTLTLRPYGWAWLQHTGRTQKGENGSD